MLNQPFRILIGVGVRVKDSMALALRSLYLPSKTVTSCIRALSVTLKGYRYAFCTFRAPYTRIKVLCSLNKMFCYFSLSKPVLW